MLRTRLIIGFAIAVALHLGIVFVWWLTPPLRLKANYAPERWVHVVSVSKESPKPVPASSVEPRPEPARSHALHRRLPIAHRNPAIDGAADAAPPRP